MRISASLLLGLALGTAVPGMAAAAERKSCLSPEERRAALAAHKAVPLAQAMHVVKAKLRGEVVKARLCRQERGLVYVLTVLARDGKVTQARVDAADGQWLEGSGG
ncbi:MAG: hypothetical protein WDO17_11375 [Alphaproteobacteria bacterium]